MAGFENDLLAVKNDHNALAAKLNSMLYLKVRYLSQQKTSSYNIFVCVGDHHWGPLRAIMLIVASVYDFLSRTKAGRSR